MVEKKKPRLISEFITDMEDELKIDENRLEDELKRHPELRNDVGKELAYAISRRDEAKQRVKEIEADCAKTYREAAEIEQKAGGRTKASTEKEIESAVILDRDVQKAKRILIHAELDVNLLEALTNSFKDRGYAIGRLVDLWLDRYYDKESVHKPEEKIKSAKVGRAIEAQRESYAKERRHREREPPF